MGRLCQIGGGVVHAWRIGAFYRNQGVNRGSFTNCLRLRTLTLWSSSLLKYPDRNAGIPVSRRHPTPPQEPPPQNSGCGAQIFYNGRMSDWINQTLVVGASGRVGRLIARAWALAGQAPTLQHRGGALPTDLPQLEWHPLSGTALESGRFRAMIVLAGAVRGDLALNAQLAEACCAAAAQAGIGQVLLASSSAVYGVNGGQACREDTPTVPVNDYGRAKLVAEAVAALWRGRGLAVTALRIGNVAGADTLLANLQPGQLAKIDCFADGSGPVRSYIGPRTLADVLAQLLGQDLPPVLNLGAPHPVAMADLAQAAGADWRYQPAPATAHQRITLDCGQLAQHYRFTERQSDAAAMVAEWQSTRGQP